MLLWLLKQIQGDAECSPTASGGAAASMSSKDIVPWLQLGSLKLDQIYIYIYSTCTGHV